MNAISIESMARDRIDSLHREAAADRLAALIKQATPNHPNIVRERLTRSAGRLRLVLSGSAG